MQQGKNKVGAGGVAESLCEEQFTR